MDFQMDFRMDFLMGFRLRKTTKKNPFGNPFRNSPVGFSHRFWCGYGAWGVLSFRPASGAVFLCGVKGHESRGAAVAPCTVEVAQFLLGSAPGSLSKGQKGGHRTHDPF